MLDFSKLILYRRPVSWESSYNDDFALPLGRLSSSIDRDAERHVSSVREVRTANEFSQLPPRVHQAFQDPHFVPDSVRQRSTFVSDVNDDQESRQQIEQRRRDSDNSVDYREYHHGANSQRGSSAGQYPVRYHTSRRPYNQDEFDGPSQVLPVPLPHEEHARSQLLLNVSSTLEPEEQDRILRRAEDVLSECAFHFVAKYQFPVPLERDKPRVHSPQDREWTEWAYLLKRLATKRRIPARVLYEKQIKQLVTTIENSIAARQSSNRDSPARRGPKDDRYILQLISSGMQVARLLMDSLALEQLDILYQQTEAIILDRRQRARSGIIAR